MLVDTGGGGSGGMYWIGKFTAQRLHLKSIACTADGRHPPVVRLPDYQVGLGLPPPGEAPCGAALLVFPQPADSNYDGQLSAGYLTGRTWTFDYPKRRLTFESDVWKPDAVAQRTPLGFPRDADGTQAS
ncbi:hypothetical protein DWU98_03780 [Dyella monticola]|uniref:Uncharacterized protein n=1 Tax=Dyella monticola TaxID=1927958 RepID=A0A370X9M0_9GAMM|nr:hypothetical protein [Dyella monticola]RDS85066.1 hypothetical protein DWU98_03780 [Dyella monticola]